MSKIINDLRSKSTSSTKFSSYSAALNSRSLFFLRIVKKISAFIDNSVNCLTLFLNLPPQPTFDDAGVDPGQVVIDRSLGVLDLHVLRVHRGRILAQHQPEVTGSKRKEFVWVNNDSCD